MGSITRPLEWWNCDSKSINVIELSPLSGHPEGSFEIQYRPLLLNSQPIEAILTLTSKELGTFKYKLILSTSSPTLRRMLRFEVPLGGVQIETFLFRVYNSVKSDFTCSVKQSEIFSLQKILTVDTAANGWEGDDVRLSVSFEPTEIGTVRDVLTVTSPISGEYLCDIIATCTAPVPQGPFNLTRGGGICEIPFRNCFSFSCLWSFSVDSPAFRLSVSQATVNGKSQGSCSVAFDPVGDLLNSQGGVIAGKLFINCVVKPEMPPWVFYLRGNLGNDGGAVTPSRHNKK